MHAYKTGHKWPVLFLRYSEILWDVYCFFLLFYFWHFSCALEVVTLCLIIWIFINSIRLGLSIAFTEFRWCIIGSYNLDKLWRILMFYEWLETWPLPAQNRDTFHISKGHLEYMYTIHRCVSVNAKPSDRVLMNEFVQLLLSLLSQRWR